MAPRVLDKAVNTRQREEGGVRIELGFSGHYFPSGIKWARRLA